MVYDINQYGVMIMPKSNATLRAMTKAELIEYIRILEHDYNVAVDFNERQARNIEQMMKDGRLIEQKHGAWIPHFEDVEIYNAGGFKKRKQTGWTCSECKKGFTPTKHKYCDNCGAKMELKEETK